MMRPMNPDIRIFSDLASLNESAAQSIKESINKIDGSAQYFLALAGGNTPRALYRLLADKYVHNITWDKVQLFWGDERYVSIEDSRNNFRMARETLLDYIPIPSKQIHPMQTDYPDPNDAARAYELTLRNHFHSQWPRFNLIILGLGSDGHTASLFPKSVSLEEKRWVIPSRAPIEPTQRLTLTLPVLSNAAQIFFIVTGADKAEVLKKVLARDADVINYPAAGVLQKNMAVTIWTDKDASKLLRQM
jgi:6-phosphogluconolactonase